MKIVWPSRASVWHLRCLFKIFEAGVEILKGIIKGQYVFILPLSIMYRVSHSATYSHRPSHTHTEIGHCSCRYALSQNIHSKRADCLKARSISSRTAGVVPAASSSSAATARAVASSKSWPP